jgi:uracil-DNA glycosylase
MMTPKNEPADVPRRSAGPLPAGELPAAGAKVKAATVFGQINDQLLSCSRCPRLRRYCLKVAQVKRASYRDQRYHGLPVANFGDPSARLMIIGLAPAAHGANRTGRMFTGDRSGDFLYARLHAAGFANQPTAVSADDGLELHDVLITAACHCAPPGNKPLPQELAACAHWLDRTFDMLTDLRVVMCLGAIGFEAMVKFYQGRGWIQRRGGYRFGHAAEYAFAASAGVTPPTLLGCYHPSQQNTFTGRLTATMMDQVLARARELIGG